MTRIIESRTDQSHPEHFVTEPTEVRRDDRVDNAITTRHQFLHPAGLVGAAAGVVLLVMGLVGLVRGELSGSVHEPLYDVGGFTHSPLLSLLEVGAGVALLVFGLSGWLSALIATGVAVAVAGVVSLIENRPLSDNLIIEENYSWIVIGIGTLVALAGALMPSVERFRRREIDTTIRHE